MKSLTVPALALALAARGAHAYWRMSCGIIQTGRIDPIVSFDTVSSHVHKISGASNININSTYESLRESECTSCTIQADKSAYWTPLLTYEHADGTFEEVPNSGMAVYYLDRGDTRNWTAFPPGLRMLSGDTTARSYDNETLTAPVGGRPVADRVSFVCIDANNDIPQTAGLENVNCPDGLRAQIQMQSCWDGVNLYLPDQSHVAYLSQIDNGVCPPGYPVLLPHLFYEVQYAVTEIDTSDGGRFIFSNGDDTGFGFHGDFQNGWDPEVLQDAIDNCLGQDVNGVVDDCSAFTASNDDNSPQNCPERTPVYPCEKVHGTLQSLPGCSVSGDLVSCPGGVPAACPPVFDTHGREAVAGNDQYSLLGCYTEATSGRALTEKSYTDTSNMTAESCLAFCSGYLYAGVEFGQECYCGNTLSTGSVNTTMNDCNMPCTGDMFETCGAGRLLNMYQLKSGQPTAGPRADNSTGNYIYQGCFTEGSSGRALSVASTSSDSMTVESCASFCGAFPMFGVEFGRECYCGSYLMTGSTSAPEVDCSMTCSGDSSEFCGAGGRLNVYALSNYTKPSIPPTVGNYKYAGCYTEASSGRALSSTSKIDYNAMTLEICAAFCQGYSFFGVEFAGECYCGNSFAAGSTLAPNGNSDCSSTCPGNYTELACGAGSRLSVYALSNVTLSRHRFR